MMTSNLIICMGVSGSGKSTLAEFLASEIEAQFIEADDFHSKHSVEKMKSGVPLTDTDRETWIASLCEAIFHAEGDVVMAFSGLRANHRKRFHKLEKRPLFLKLEIPPEVAELRLSQRPAHFMPKGLVASQFDAMEAHADDETIFLLDGCSSLNELQEVATKKVAEFIVQAPKSAEGKNENF